MNDDQEKSDKSFAILFVFLKKIIDASVCELPINDKRHYATVLTNTVRRQAYVIHVLLDGLQAGESKLIESISVSAIARSMLETYLVFNHIFIASESDAEQEFKYYAWILDTLIRREEKYDIKNFEHIAEFSGEGRKEIEHAREVINALARQQKEVRDLMSNNDFFKAVQAIGDRNRTEQCNAYIRRGWFPRNFETLMRKADMQYFLKTHAYEWMSAHAHPSFSVLESCRKAVTYEAQFKYNHLAKSTALMLLGHLCIEYPKIYPQCQKLLNDHPLEAALANEIVRRIRQSKHE